MQRKVLSVALLLCGLPLQGALAGASASGVHPYEQSAADAPLWTAQQKGLAEEEAKYLKQIKEDPDNPEAYALLANLYLLQNKAAKAVPAYQDAIMHDAENPKLFASLSIAYLHQARYSMAKAMADQAVLLAPDMEQARKIQQYIVAKQAVIAQASAQNGAIPNDDIHRAAGAGSP